MTVTEYMAKVTAAAATGEYVGRDMVLGVDCAATPRSAAQFGNFTYVGAHVEDYGAELDPKTEDKSYVYEGDSPIKTSTQRTFSISGQAYISDEFMDFVRSFAVKFGKGTTVQRRYVYFHSGTGKGESGVVTVIVKNDGNGSASGPADVEVEMKSCGPVSEFTWSA